MKTNITVAQEQQMRRLPTLQQKKVFIRNLRGSQIVVVARDPSKLEPVQVKEIAPAPVPQLVEAPKVETLVAFTPIPAINRKHRFVINKKAA
jgi:hypothetical protein